MVVMNSASIINHNGDAVYDRGHKAEGGCDGYVSSGLIIISGNGVIS